MSRDLFALPKRWSSLSKRLRPSNNEKEHKNILRTLKRDASLEKMSLLRCSAGGGRIWTRGHHRAPPEIASIIRVDHAGEFGADRIYAGQMAVLGNSSVGPKIKEMWEQEKEHRAQFEKLIVQRRVRPTAMLPLWDIAGFALGAGTALLGAKGAMACTVAVESVIVDHYNDQLRQLTQEDSKLSPEKQQLCDVIKKFRDEEQEHHDTGIEYGALEAPFYETLTSVIKAGCKAAIEISKKI